MMWILFFSFKFICNIKNIWVLFLFTETLSRSSWTTETNLGIPWMKYHEAGQPSPVAFFGVMRLWLTIYCWGTLEDLVTRETFFSPRLKPCAQFSHSGHTQFPGAGGQSHILLTRVASSWGLAEPSAGLLTCESDRSWKSRGKWRPVQEAPLTQLIFAYIFYHILNKCLVFFWKP